MKDCCIRRATPADLPKIMLIEQDSFAEGVRETKTTFEERISVFPQGFLLLTIANQVVGYFSSELWEKDIAKNDFLPDNFKLGHSAQKSYMENGNTLYISSIGILSEFRGKGLGMQFFDECTLLLLKKFPLIKQLVLIVNEKWLAARRIYQRSHFSEITTFDNFFEQREENARYAGIVMLKKLAERA